MSSDKEISHLILDLGKMPLVNNLNKSFEDSIDCELYPLSIDFFEKDNFMRLTDLVDPSQLFHTYLYQSGINKPYIQHCKEMHSYIQNYISLGESDLMVDIGGNDGSLINVFRKENSIIQTINVEPSNLYELSVNSGIETINDFFGKDVVNKINKKAKLITTTNVFQHLYDIKSFSESIYDLLSDDGVWCLEFPYLIKTLETLQFDQIYHEHVYYYHVTALNNFFESFGLKIINTKEYPIHGGSMRLIISKKESGFERDLTVEKYLENEKKYDLDFFKNWGKVIEDHVTECKRNLLKIMKNDTIFGFGAEAKGCTFLNYLGFTYKNIKLIIDDTPMKQNLFVPGTGIQIFSREILLEQKPDYILILPHNFKDYIIESLRNYGYTGKFIVCFPKFEII